MEVRNQPVFRKIVTKCYGCDVSRETQVDDTARKILGEFGNVDILVNNAGIFMDDWSHFSESKVITGEKRSILISMRRCISRAQ